jgi:AcrR family transcriptional regulator
LHTWFTDVKSVQGLEAGVVEALSRRDRVRAATTEEIKQTARRIVMEQGIEAASLRAIAGEMGMTAPALYRYFGSRDELVKHVIADIFAELAAAIRQAIDAAAAASGGDMTAKVMAACWAFRDWSLGHTREFGLIFATPLPGLHVQKDEITAKHGGEFGNTFFLLMLEVWRKTRFEVPPDDQIDPGLRVQLERYRDGLAGLADGLPLGLLLTFLRCWVRLYGIVGLEVFGHLSFALDDGKPMFELMLAEMAPQVGLEYPRRTSAMRDAGPG